MRWIVPTTYGGHARISPCYRGDAVQIELFGVRGGVLGGMAFDTDAFAPQLLHSLAKALEEAREIRAKAEPVDFEAPDFTAVPELGVAG